LLIVQEITDCVSNKLSGAQY